MKQAVSIRIIFAVLILALLPYAVAQQGGQGGGTGGTGSTGGTGGTSSKPSQGSPTTISPSSPQTTQPQMPQQIFISGNVVQDDGSPPPFGAVIELDCGSTVIKEATVSTNGHFAFQLGDPARFSNVLPDASQRYSGPFDRSSDDGGVGGGYAQGMPSVFQTTMPATSLASRYAGCDLRAQLGGYRSSAIKLDRGPLSGMNEIGTIVIYPVARMPGSVVSATSLLAPKEAKKSVEKGKKAFQKKKYEESESLLKSAIAAYPNYAEAWFQLGQLYQYQQRNEEARKAFAKAKETDPLYVSPYVWLGLLASREKKWQEAADFTEQALALDPITFPEVYYVNALANYNLRNLDLAEKRARQEQRLDGAHQFPRVHLILANIMSARNDTGGSIEEMRSYLKYAPNAEDAALVRSRLQEKLAKSAEK